jgi:hypothetical protein
VSTPLGSLLTAPSLEAFPISARPFVAKEPQGSLNSGFGLGFARPNPHRVWPFSSTISTHLEAPTSRK